MRQVFEGFVKEASASGFTSNGKIACVDVGIHSNDGKVSLEGVFVRMPTRLGQRVVVTVEWEDE